MQTMQYIYKYETKAHRASAKL